jgi:hypothetical protein
MDYRLVSTGGVGTWALAEWASDRLTRQGWPGHRRDPRVETDHPIKMVYVVGDPRLQLLSFHRRGFLKSPYDHCKHVGGDIAGISQELSWDLDTYLKNGRDYFQLEQHFNGWWLFPQRTYHIMFIKYDALPRRAEELRIWLDKKDSFVFKKRKSNLHDQPWYIHQGLERLYGRFAERVRMMPDVVYKHPGDK